MIQFFKENSSGFQPLPIKIYLNSVFEVFSEIEELSKKITDVYGKDNIHYSIHSSAITDETTRSFVAGNCVIYDIDDCDYSFISNYITIFERFSKLPFGEFSIVQSGHGFHFVVHLEHPYSKQDLMANRMLYSSSCDKLQKLLKDDNLLGKIDKSFHTSKTLRLPNTINHKIKKELPPVECSLLLLGKVQPDTFQGFLTNVCLLDNPTIDPQEDPIKKPPLVSVPVFKDHKKPHDTKLFITELEKRCAFFIYSAANPNSITEQEWFYLLTILAYDEDPRTQAHKYSKNYNKYSMEETNQKMQGILSKEYVAPMCKTIKQFNKCGDCKEVCHSPVNLVPVNHISSEEKGFWIVTIGEGGKLKSIPDYNGARDKIMQDHKVIVSELDNKSYVYSDGVYIIKDDLFFLSKISAIFKPELTENITSKRVLDIMKNKAYKTKDSFKDHSNLLCFKNGLLNTDTGEFMPHSPMYFIKDKLNYNYDPTAKSDLFMRFLRQVLEKDKDKVDIILEFFTYALFAKNERNDKILVMFGEGRNGKTTIIKIMRKIFGEAATEFSLSSVKEKFHMSMLEGKKLALIDEVPSARDTQTWEKMKSLSSGSELIVDQKNSKIYTAKNNVKFTMTCNKMPRGTDVTIGYMRRLLPVEFALQIAEENKDILMDDKLEAELAGIFNILYNKSKEFKKTNYYIKPRVVTEEFLDEYRKDIDDVYLYFTDHFLSSFVSSQKKLIFRDVSRYVFTSDSLFENYVNFCKDQGSTFLVKKREFIKRFKTLSDLEPKRTKTEGKEFFGYTFYPNKKTSIQTIKKWQEENKFVLDDSDSQLNINDNDSQQVTDNESQQEAQDVFTKIALETKEIQ